MDISLKHLKTLLRTLESGGASEFEYQDEKFRIRVALGSSAAAAAAPRAPAVERVDVGADTPATAPNAPAVDPKVAFITSPFVGTFYRAPAPGAEPFVQPGASVKQGQTLCIVEAMKLMNEIEAEYPCAIQEVLLENGASVEFGQKLFKVSKS